MASFVIQYWCKYVSAGVGEQVF